MTFNLSVCAAALLFVFGASAEAQPLNCTVSTDGITFRVEGTTEPIGDVFIQCAANDRTPAGQAYVTGDVKIFINTNIVNRFLAGGSTDVVLIVNENHAPPTSASTLGGPLKNFPVPQFGQFFPPNAFAVNALQWSAVKIPIPGATAPDGSVFPSRTTLRITNMRVNAAQLGLSSSLLPTQVVLLNANIADAQAVPTANAQQTLGTLAQGLITTVPIRGELPQCQSQNIVNGAVNGPTTFSVRFKEGFEYAFRPLGQPTTDRGIRAGEDGYTTPGIGANGGGADQGTRLFVRLNNIGFGVRIAAPATITNGTLSLQLLLNNDPNGAGPYHPVAGNGLVELTLTAGTAIAVYEVVKSDITAIESVDIPFVVGYTANPAANLPSPGATTVNASLAPLSTFGTASSTAPVPRFVDFSVARNAFFIDVCTGPPPVISRVTPSSLPAATGMDAVLRVDGSGFSADSAVEWNGTALQTMLGRDANVFLSTLVPASLTTRPGTAQLDVVNPDGQRSGPLVFTITGAPPPAVNNGGAVNAASSQAILTRGCLASLYGIALATSMTSASGFPLPPVLANVKVTVNGRAAPLIYVSPGQINFQVPFEAPLTGTATIVVTRDGIDSAAVTVNLAEFAPGIFRSSIGPILLHSDYSLVTPSKPAVPNEILIAYGTGLGGLNSPPDTGSATPASPPVTARLLPSITIGGQPAEVQFAGLASGFAGLAQFNFRVPPTLPPGSLQILVLGYGSNTDSVPLAVLSSAAGQITSLNPSSAPAPSSGINLTVNGSGFTNSAVVQWTQNGQTMPLSTTFVNSTMLTARIPGNLLAGQGTALITVLNGNGSSSNALTFTITAPPTIFSFYPSSIVAGATGFTLAVTGRDFTTSSVVRWNGVALPTTFVSGIKLFASVSNNAVSSVGTASITVADGGLTSNSVTVVVVGSFGASFSNQRVTKEVPPASGCVLPTAQTSFSVADGFVFLYFTAMVTLKDSLTDDWLAPDGTLVLDPPGWTPASGNFCFDDGLLKIPVSPVGAWEGRVYDNGALVFAVPFTIGVAPAVTIASLSPSSAPVLSPAINLTVNGTGFAGRAAVQWSRNGQTTSLSTTFVSSTTLTALVPASLLTTQGLVQITVLNDNGSVSNPVTFTVTAPTVAPAIASLSPSAVYGGAGSFRILVNGTGFGADAVVLWNNSALTTTYVSSTKLLAAVDNGLTFSLGTASVAVSSGGKVSGAVSLPVRVIPSAQIMNQRVTKSAPLPVDCPVSPPPAVNSFSTSDVLVYLYFDGTTTAKDFLTSEWLGPDGGVIADAQWPPSAGNFCFTGSELSVSALPSGQLGAWDARVYDNGSLLFSIPFSVHSGASASGNQSLEPAPREALHK